MAEEMISVIVPVYMGEQWLNRCIEAIRNQSFQNLEIVLVDDGSPDNSGQICDETAAIDDRIKVVHKENGGLSDARNAGIKAAAGKYIMFVDEDDYIHPDMAKILYQTLKKTEADIVVCDFLPISDKEKVIYPKIDLTAEPKCFEGQEIMNQLYYRNLMTVVAWNKLYRKEVFEKHGYIKGRVHDDESAIHFILHACRRTAYIDEKLYYYVQREGSITSNRKWNYYSDGWQAYGERLAFLEENGYAEMASFTKEHMLHYVVTYYKMLRGSAQADEVKKQMRLTFKELLRDEELMQRLSPALRRSYKCFALHPVFYRLSLGMESIGSNIKRIIRGIGHRVKKLIKKADGCKNKNQDGREQ